MSYIVFAFLFDKMIKRMKYLFIWFVERRDAKYNVNVLINLFFSLLKFRNIYNFEKYLETIPEKYKEK